MQISNLNRYFDSNLDEIINDWKEFLSFESVSSDPEFNNSCLDCANWMVKHLAKLGFESRLLETIGKPVVFAQLDGNPDLDTILFYGHYDVQPADPFELWDHPPFEPTLIDDRMFARGAQDNKGQVFFVLKAIQALRDMEQDLPTIKILIEGEEESGSYGITDSLPSWNDLVKADVVLVADTCTVHSGAPTIIMGLRGIINLTLSLSGPNKDLHSGVHGGLSPNPAAEMARLIASLHNDDGSIAVEGFCDLVTEPTDEDLELAKSEPFIESQYIEETGIAPTGGEQNLDPIIRAGFRPTIDINGITSGYSGAGPKTIIPSQALAKVTARLVPNQNPDECLKAIIDHVHKFVHKSLKLEITEQGVGGPGFRLNPNSPITLKARKILDELFELKTAFLWEGASIPIVTLLAEVSEGIPLLCGFGREEDNIHAPNESFSIEQFKSGYQYIASLLSSL